VQEAPEIIEVSDSISWIITNPWKTLGIVEKSLKFRSRMLRLFFLMRERSGKPLL
jgi:hypothetical protein